MAYDEDGTVVFYGNQDGSGALTELTTQQRIDLNDEDQSGHDKGNPAAFYWLIFPELREVDGFFAARSAGNAEFLESLYSSGDTTNGRDGVWTQQIANVDNAATVLASYRTNITSLAVPNQRGIRMGQAAYQSGKVGSSVTAIHVYGEIFAGQTPDRLLFLDSASGLEFGLPIDYGDVPRGSAADRLIKLKNNSTSLTAGSVQLTAESLYLNSAAWYTFSEDGVLFQGTLPLTAAIGPGASSPTITLRRDIPDSETPGLHAGRVQASVGSWT